MGKIYLDGITVNMEEEDGSPRTLVLADKEQVDILEKDIENIVRLNEIAYPLLEDVFAYLEKQDDAVNGITYPFFMYSFFVRYEQLRRLNEEMQKGAS